jgi:hypothetical protein
MRFGMHLRELTRQRFGFALSLLLATFVALSAGYRVSLFPPSLAQRSVDIATASTQVLVDTPRPAVLDMRAGTADFKSMSNRAVLIGNVMASLPVREYIARRAHVPAELIKAQTPLTPDFPRAIAGTENQKRTSDILRSTDEYRLNIQANPTVPVVDVYAQAPTPEAAASLANAAVDGMHDYLAAVARVQAVRDRNQVRLEQLGRASGHVINGGARLQLVLLAFVFSFALFAATVLFIGRVRVGWRRAAVEELQPRDALGEGA